MFAEIRNFSEARPPRKTGSRRRSSKMRSDPASCAHALDADIVWLYGGFAGSAALLVKSVQKLTPHS